MFRRLPVLRGKALSELTSSAPKRYKLEQVQFPILSEFFENQNDFRRKGACIFEYQLHGSHVRRSESHAQRLRDADSQPDRPWPLQELLVANAMQND
jgi:hypothetical protein